MLETNPDLFAKSKVVMEVINISPVPARVAGRQQTIFLAPHCGRCPVQVLGMEEIWLSNKMDWTRI